MKRKMQVLLKAVGNYIFLTDFPHFNTFFLTSLDMVNNLCITVGSLITGYTIIEKVQFKNLGLPRVYSWSLVR